MPRGTPGLTSSRPRRARTFYYAVRNDPAESVLTPCSAEDRKLVADSVPGLHYVNDPGEIAANAGGGPQSRELWWLMLAIVMALLICEMLYSRRLAANALQP